MSALRAPVAFLLMAALLLAVGWLQSWSVALNILNLCLISAIMALGVNIQWGYAGIFNVGIMGFAALGGAATVLVAMPPVPEAWAAGGGGLALAGLLLVATPLAAWWVSRRLRRAGGWRVLATIAVAVAGYAAMRYVGDPAIEAIEAVDSARTGYLGGLGLPILLSWAVGGLLAAGAAWLVGRIALGLRADYLAIATLGISEVILAMLKNEDWLTRGVKNVTGLPRPVPYELDLQSDPAFAGWVEWLYADALAAAAPDERAAVLQRCLIEASSLAVKLCYTGLFVLILLIILSLCVLALNSPWGRSTRAIRDNETAANAMGKDVTRRHLQIFILGSAVVGIAGAMLTTLDGQFTPGTYQPLRFTFLILVMVVIGGAGNNLGAVLGGFLIWFFWIEAEPVGRWLLDLLTGWLDDGNAVRQHLLAGAQYMRVIMMGLALLLIMRFHPGGILPERGRERV